MAHANPFNTSIASLDDLTSLSEWAQPSLDLVRQTMMFDPAHDESHLLRVVRNALWFGEDGDKDVIIPAALCHDLVNLPKSHHNRSLASTLSAIDTITALHKTIGFKDRAHCENIRHAIVAHSFSAKTAPYTLEAKAVQDADRIDSLGLLGITRMFSVGGSMGRALFHPTDPLAENRELDEYAYSLDHYATKLGTLRKTMTTPRGIVMATNLTIDMEVFIKDLIMELEGVQPKTRQETDILQRVARFGNLGTPSFGL